VGIFAKGIHDHQRYRLVINNRTHHQAVTSGISKPSFGELNVPVITVHQMVGVTERQRISRISKGRHVFTRRTQLTNQRILLAGNQQFS